MKKKKAQQTKRECFIVMNSQLQYVNGMILGGELVWCNYYNEAKPLDNERKFQTLKSLCYGEELILDYI